MTNLPTATDVNYLVKLANRCRKYGDDYVFSPGGWDRFASDVADELDEIAGKLTYLLTASHPT
jgi:hypothetical protein